MELGPGGGVGQHQAAVHHRHTLVELQLHLQRVVLRQRQLARAQTPWEGKNERDVKSYLHKTILIMIVVSWPAVGGGVGRSNLKKALL